ncbi:MFS transporter [Aliiroseovarius sp. PTFE2010]|uniref:MFS transporter n=1 Tax=Aliiroseovarius sp. PTFE2010 TaxID=3417190 RepID=UPI003CF1E620
MIQVLATSWALLLGLLLLMVGNGLQGTVLGVRGALEGFSTGQMSVIMSAYFVGFLGGSRLTPEMIRRVGHVRVFAALASFVSAALILFPTVVQPWAWVLFRVIVGFCFSGIYVTAESWLNNSATNETRGKALSLYMIVQTLGIIAAQGIVAIGEPSGFILFIVPSVLVSISFAPILLSVSPTPPFETTKRMTLRELYAISPLGCVSIFLMGGVFSTQFGMAAVYGAMAGLSVGQISALVAAIYAGALALQFPIGWISDRMDRRVLIMVVAVLGGAAALFGAIMANTYVIILGAAALTGGAANPLYSLIVAHANDHLETDDMASASAGMLFLNGVGAILGPLISGWLMGVVGPSGFWVVIAGFMFAVAGYAAWRMAQRPSVAVEDTASYAPILPSATPVAMEVAQEWAIDQAETDTDDQGASPAQQ